MNKILIKSNNEIIGNIELTDEALDYISSNKLSFILNPNGFISKGKIDITYFSFQNIPASSKEQ